jgi:ubiquinone/menaquinone biosynthesis C-methylase UbiE
MNDEASKAERREHYSPGYSAELVSSYQARDVRVEAAFLSGYLRPGMSLLDCGCGPGTITAGLAEIVAPGAVTAVDIEPSQVERARWRRQAPERAPAGQ